ncbi:MAG TPA: YihY/virulence factor BrkB family protein [Candidatus Baltobacterales bacterium]|nr:YihY/virulence factor BrkB family protein [Candidatus Baltobacterales bacterium]
MRNRIMQAVRRAQKTVPVRVLTAFGESQASNYASALAFAGFLAMFPMMLGALSIIGLMIRNPGTEAHFQALILQVFPGNAQPELRSAIQGVKQSAGWMGLVSIGGLVWSASSIFATMEFALTEIFGTKQRDMVRQKLMGFVMMLLLVVAVVFTVGVNSISGFLPYAWIVSLLLGALVMVGLLVLLYRFVPNRTFTLQEVLPGAVLAGVLIEVLSLAFPLYARYAGSFNTYGAQFGLFFLLATWFYLLSELLLLGAVYNRFRMGEPVKRGLIASPLGDSRQNKRPVEAIKENKAKDGPTPKQISATEASSPAKRRRSAFQRLALSLAVAVAVAAGIVRRRARPKTAS